MLFKLRLWLSYNILPRDISKALDYAIALGCALEEREFLAKASDPNGEARTLYIPANHWPLYDKFMDGPCLFPSIDVYEEIGL